MQDLNFLKRIRNTIIQELKDLPIEQLNTIPLEFNNNILWNAAHLVASDQRMFYIRSGQEPLVPANFIEKYQKGTRPEGLIDESEANEIKKLLSYSLEKFELDYKNNLFNNYQSWTTSYGNTISTIEDAIVFLPFHEGLHLGCIKALKKIAKTY